jgi:hypothetical protein
MANQRYKRNPEMATYKAENVLCEEITCALTDRLDKLKQDMKRAVKQAGINYGLAERYNKEIDKQVDYLKQVTMSN